MLILIWKIRLALRISTFFKNRFLEFFCFFCYDILEKKKQNSFFQVKQRESELDKEIEKE